MKNVDCRNKITWIIFEFLKHFYDVLSFLKNLLKKQSKTSLLNRTTFVNKLLENVRKKKAIKVFCKKLFLETKNVIYHKSLILSFFCTFL